MVVISVITGIAIAALLILAVAIITDENWLRRFNAFRDVFFDIKFSCVDCVCVKKFKDPGLPNTYHCVCLACKDIYNEEPMPTTEARYSKQCRMYKRPIIQVTNSQK